MQFVARSTISVEVTSSRELSPGLEVRGGNLNSRRDRMPAADPASGNTASTLSADSS